MARIKDRPRVKYQRLNGEHPFLLTVDEGRVLVPMRLGDAHGLSIDLDVALGQFRAALVCRGDRHHPGLLVAALDDGSVVHRCRHCPAEFVTRADGAVAPVDGGP